ncbi:MAG: hypothetical protein AVDCRST_MAG59-1844 [uncultured Thermomicrobiales bacterium]|uniref:Uncharacterized protein n=1 Tax=uncultured Thermomicrobiales bacterium TaxID=1645740 RepID=A0A6J4UJ59_9BACT|nr:MAG: hypothetical protein AVDCRST_MAG59-1844 [uncultured Thermomicrobiales bacterium]
MGFHQRGDDGQAEAGAAGVAGSPGVGPPEALEDPPLRLPRDARPLVGDLQLGLVADPVDGDANGGAGEGVGAGVGQEVVDDLAQPDRVAEDDGRPLQLPHQGPVRFDGGEVGHRLAGEGDEVDRLSLQHRLAVEPGQQQQVLD